MSFTAKFIFCYLLIGLICLSCEKPKKATPTDGLLVKIDHSSGDDFYYDVGEERTYFAPYPFNHATISFNGQTYEMIILSKKVTRGKTIKIRPIAQFTLSDPDRGDSFVLVAVPTEMDLQITQIKDYYEMTVKQFYFKQMVQYWYSNRYGLNGTVVKGWEPVSLMDFTEQ